MKFMRFPKRVMRILIAGKTGDDQNIVRDSHALAATLAAELRNRRHDAHLWEPGNDLSGVYDLAIIQDVAHSRMFSKHVKRSIQIVSGVCDEDRPDACSITAFVCESVRDFWKGNGPIVRRPIDVDFWKPVCVTSGGAIMYGDQRSSLPWAQEACRSLSMRFKYMENTDATAKRFEFSSASVVLAGGRSALEAMACGTRVVLYDRSPSNLEPCMGARNLNESMKQDYAGIVGQMPKEVDVRAWIRDCVMWSSTSHVPADPRAWVLKHHNVRSIVNTLLRVARR